MFILTYGDESKNRKGPSLFLSSDPAFFLFSSLTEVTSLVIKIFCTVNIVYYALILFNS